MRSASIPRRVRSGSIPWLTMLATSLASSRVSTCSDSSTTRHPTRLPSLAAITRLTPMLAFPDEPLRVIVHRMAETGLTRFVVDRASSTLIGVVALDDLLKARPQNLDSERRRERRSASRMWLACACDRRCPDRGAGTGSAHFSGLISPSEPGPAACGPEHEITASSASSDNRYPNASWSCTDREETDCGESCWSLGVGAGSGIRSEMKTSDS